MDNIAALLGKWASSFTFVNYYQSSQMVQTDFTSTKALREPSDQFFDAHDEFLFYLFFFCMGAKALGFIYNSLNVVMSDRKNWIYIKRIKLKKGTTKEKVGWKRRSK